MGKGNRHNRKNLHTAKMDGETRIPPEQMKSYRVVDYSDTTNPYTAAEVRKFLKDNEPGKQFDVDPNRVRFMHAGVADTFSNGTSVADLVETLTDDPTYIKHTPAIMLAAVEVPIRKWEAGTQAEGGERELMLFTEDHRRVVAARTAGVRVMKAQMKADPTVSSNFTTKSLGMRLEVRHYHDREEGKHQGGNKTTLPGSSKIYRYGETQDED